MDDLQDLTMGIYQLKQAPQYTREHIEPEYELFSKELIASYLDLLLTRFPSSTKHFTWFSMRARTSICCAKASPSYELFLVKDDPNLIRCKIQSRHTNSAVHALWVEFSSSNVTGWYCTCKIGAKTVGCCYIEINSSAKSIIPPQHYHYHFHCLLLANH
jgi:hypothetical protein